MKIDKLLEILDEEFPEMAASSEDYIGTQISIKEDISKVLVTLDVTLEVISQAIEKKVDLIISHHPLFFGDKIQLLENNLFLKAKVQLLTDNNIGLFVIHTNADFNPNSIAYMQALAIGLKNVEQNNENLSVSGEFEKEIIAKEFVDLIKENLELKDVEFRSNFDLSTPIKKVIIASGAGGEEINGLNNEYVFVIGEIKHHEWVKASELNLKVIEISHYSEKIFKDMILILLENEEIEVILSEESNGYKII